MGQRIRSYVLPLLGVILGFSLALPIGRPLDAQAGPQYRVVIFDPKSYVDQSERIAEVCNSEARGGWTFVSMGTVVTTTYLVFRR